MRIKFGRMIRPLACGVAAAALCGGALAQALTPEEWREQGAFFFRAQRFNGAAQCFEKTKDEEDHVLLAEARARIHSAFKVQADPYC